jgi:hypothetical protein
MNFFVLWIVVIALSILAGLVFGETGFTVVLGLGGLVFLINAIISSGKGGSGGGDDNFPEPPDDFDL